MFSYLNTSLEGDNKDGLIEKCRNMFQAGGEAYFDVPEFEYLIDYYTYKRKNKEMETLVNLSLKQHPTALPLQIRKVNQLINSRQENKALDLLKGLEGIESSKVDALMLKGTAYAIKKEISKAQKNFDLALAHNPDGDCTEQINLLFHIANAFVNAFQYQIAISYLEKVLDINYKDLNALYLLSHCYTKIANNDFALYYYNEYLNINPYSANVWLKIGIIYKEEYNLEKACEALDYAIAIKPNSLQAYYVKADILLAHSKYTEAIEVYLEIIEKEEEKKKCVPPIIYCQMAQCYEKLDDDTNAKKYYHYALNINKKDTTVLCKLGYYHFQKQEYAETLVYLGKAIKQTPDIKVKYNLAYAIANSSLNNNIEAVNAFQKIIEREKESYNVWIAYADHHIKEKQYYEAIQVLVQTLSNVGHKAGVYYRLSVCYLSLNDSDNGLLFFNKGFELKERNTSLEDIIALFPPQKLNQKIAHFLNFEK